MKKILYLAFMLLTMGTPVIAQTTTVDSADVDALYAKDLLKPGEKAPDFTLPNYKGEKCNLYKDTKAYKVIEFWASWCPDCRRDLPKVNELINNYRAVHFYGVSFDTDSAAWQKCYWETFKMRHILELCEFKKWKESQVAKDYHISWLPTYYILTPDNKVEYATVSISKLSKKLEELKEKFQEGMQIPLYRGNTIAASNAAILSFLRKEMRYPKFCQSYGATTRVVVSFVVEKDGTLSEVKPEDCDVKFDSRKFDKASAQEQQTIRQACVDLFKNEAARVVKNMKKFEHPGVQYNEPVRVMHKIPISFQLK